MYYMYVCTCRYSGLNAIDFLLNQHGVYFLYCVNYVLQTQFVQTILLNNSVRCGVFCRVLMFFDDFKISSDVKFILCRLTKFPACVCSNVENTTNSSMQTEDVKSFPTINQHIQTHPLHIHALVNSDKICEIDHVAVLKQSLELQTRKKRLTWE